MSESGCSGFKDVQDEKKPVKITTFNPRQMSESGCSGFKDVQDEKNQ
jgi:hypothetical protein